MFKISILHEWMRSKLVFVVVSVVSYISTTYCFPCQISQDSCMLAGGLSIMTSKLWNSRTILQLITTFSKHVSQMLSTQATPVLDVDLLRQAYGKNLACESKKAGFYSANVNLLQNLVEFSALNIELDA
uniref:Uncharacterized protein n=1 Tax=Octactis speculum TaxID=3111310 RepID=A0A7S2DA85_9STRA